MILKIIIDYMYQLVKLVVAVTWSTLVLVTKLTALPPVGE